MASQQSHGMEPNFTFRLKKSTTKHGKKQLYFQFDLLPLIVVFIVLNPPKLEALKTHKKGLMQRLFPSPDVNS